MDCPTNVLLRENTMKKFSASETLELLCNRLNDGLRYVSQKISQVLAWTDQKMNSHFDIYLFLKYSLMYCVIWCVSEIGLSWVMLSIIYLVLMKEKKDKLTVRLLLAYMNIPTIKSIYIAAPKERPSWVTFPDMERVEWLNKIIRQLWPYAGHYVKDLCKYSIEPSLRTALEEYKLSGFQFEKIILGDTPPRFSGVKVYDDTSRHEIIMDMDVAYAGDCKFEVSVSKFKMGIKDLRICGKMRVVMKPLVKQIPLVGGLQVFFLNNPDVDFNLIGLADVFDMPGLSDILRSIVTDQIGYMMVLPNRYPIQLVEDIDVVELKCPLPAGVIRIHVIEAHNLMKKDVGIMGMGKSDPYCILHLGAQKFQTKTINNTINPKWDFCCEAMCNVIRRQSILIECWDWDANIPGAKNDDFLGRANLDVQEIWKSGEIDMWVPLSDAKSGRLHIRATWLELSDSAPALDLQLEEIRALQNTTKNPLHSAVLMVWVDSAKKLNPSHKHTPDPFVRLHVGNTKHETTVRQRTNDPVFEEGFSFLVRNPKTQELQVEVVDQKTNTVQGKLELDLNMLLKEKNLEIVSEDYSLSGASGGLAAIKLSLTLRILKTALKTDDGDGGPKEKGEVETSSSFTPAAISEPPSSSSSASVPQPPAHTKSSKAPPSTPPPPHPADVPEPTSALTKEDVSVADPSGVSNVATHADVPPPAKVEERKPSVETTLEEVMSSAASPLMHMLPSATDNSSLRHRPSVSNSGMHGLGRIELSVKYGPRNNLVVVVHQVQGLQKEEDGELPDPYVKLYLLPDRSKDSKRKTDVIKDECNPKFDERFEYAVSPNELTHRRLEVSVINKKGLLFLQRSSTMGQIHMDCGLLDAEKVTQWYDLAPAMDEEEE